MDVNWRYRCRSACDLPQSGLAPGPEWKAEIVGRDVDRQAAIGTVLGERRVPAGLLEMGRITLPWDISQTARPAIAAPWPNKLGKCDP